MVKSLLLMMAIVSCRLGLPSEIQAAPQISNITISPNPVAKYAKFEITFQVQTTATNPAFSYSAASPYPGAENYPYDQGVTVDAQFLPPGQANWANASTQPAFYFQDFLYQRLPSGSGTDWYYPTNNFSWKVRFAPTNHGNWQFRLTATDSTGTITTTPQSFTATDSDSHGFIKVAANDHRYFEFEDGTYFPALGYNMNYNHVDWLNPTNNAANFQAMAQNGIQLARIWLSQWSIFGSHWSPWRDFASNSTDPPWTWLVYDPQPNPQTEFAFHVSSNPIRCFSYGLNTPHPPVKPNTDYRLTLNYKTMGLSGPAVPGNYGLVIKLMNDIREIDSQTHQTNCTLPTEGQIITPYISTNTGDWQPLQVTYHTGATQSFLPLIAFVLENVTAGSAHIRYLELKEDLGGGEFGPNVIAKPSLDSHRYFDQRNSFAFDQVINLAQQYGVYLRPVTLDWREEILDHFDWYGLYTGNDLDAYLYGPDEVTQFNRSRWLQQQWWRYLQARWGYATAIHSWEYVNEGTPGSEHAHAANAMGFYFEQFSLNQHLTATSTWNQGSSTAGFWGLTNFPYIDFADIHRYIRQDTMPSQFYDAAEASLNASATFGAQSQAIQSRWPVIRGETGFVTDDQQRPISPITSDTQGVWFHNYLWAGLNPGALIESYWYENWHIYDCAAGPPPCRLRFDLRPLVKPLADFLTDIPLNQGGYSDVAASGFDTNLIRVTGQKNPTRNLAHLWIQNKRHTWCAVAGGIAGCPTTWDSSRLNGSITLSGFTTTAPLNIEWWQFDTTGQLTKTNTSQAPISGQLTLNLTSLPSTVTDVAVKIGDYTATIPTPSPPPPPETDLDGDQDTDFMDLLLLILGFGAGGLADFNHTGIVDIFDFNILLRYL
ncbi:hypothetical protein A2W24_06705 [Microgenomates group bacterium RBG_16_45_19]|nr:MAG: hypothetical protein A2W24_06705 [Microgenomates group bacterium RBG_16_45_19]